VSFKSFDLNPAILRAIDKCGYTVPTPIQAEAIPIAIEGHDIIASAHTGTGKTAAFVLPVLHLLTKKGHHKKQRGQPSVLILTPTRELANQVTQAIRDYGRNVKVSSVSLVGGMPYGPQLRSLSKPIDIVVATPGRLIDHIENRNIDLSEVNMLILDEADRMLDMGFVDEVNKIANFTPKERQTMLFTATWDGRMASLARNLLNDPQRVAMDSQPTQENIEQRLHIADDVAHKNKLLQHLLNDDSLTQAIIFSATKLGADILARDLKALGHSAAALHGDMKQAARNRTLQNMRRGKLRLLVATDVAARGIDMTSVSHVINFDIPRFAEDYVHRIGRTGRAGANGTAISFALPDDLMHLERIERYTGKQVPRLTIPGLEPTRSLARKKKKRKYNSKGPTSNRNSYNDPKHKGGGRHLTQPPAHRRKQRAAPKKTVA